VRTEDFFTSHPVFSLDDAARVLAPPRGRPGAVERLKHHLETGRLKLVARGVYAVVPADFLDRVEKRICAIDLCWGWKSGSKLT
jgi:hypothetical protein